MDLWKIPRYLWTKSPRDYWRRLAPGRHSDQRGVWALGKHRQWNRLPYYLEAFRMVAEQHGHRLDFSGRRVLEFGAGPVLGFAPFALVEGAAAVTVVEPVYTELRGESHFQDEYLHPLFCSYSRLRGRADVQDFESFLADVRRIDVRLCCAEEFEAPAAPFDIVLSKSTIMHFVDIDRAVDVCYDASASGSLHCHYLDFTMTRPANRIGSCFGSMYRTSRASNPEYFTNPGGYLNLLRMSDIVRAFERRFSAVHFLSLVEEPTCRIPTHEIHADWSRYRPEELRIANGVLLAVK